MLRLHKLCHHQTAAVFEDVSGVLCNSCKCSIKHVILFHNYVTAGSVNTIVFKNYYTARIVLILYCVVFKLFVMGNFSSFFVTERISQIKLSGMFCMNERR
jgi:hypothetical protein